MTMEGVGTAAAPYAVMLAAVALCLVLERAHPAAPRRPRGDLLNLKVWAISFFVQTGSAPALGVLVTLAVNGAGGGWIALPSAGWGLLLSVLVYLLAMDLGEYLFHRAQHAVPALWAMHSLHHSDPAMDVTTTVRHFWAEPLIKSVTVWLAVGLVLDAPPTALAVYAILSSWHFLAHANVRLGFGRFSWLLNAPQYHRLHHSREARHFDVNFSALFPIFDVISGAYRRPEPGEYPPTGLDTGEAPATLVQAALWPGRPPQSSDDAGRQLPRSAGEQTPATLLAAG
jgi:sterol desaturase/sphingolipid hydroxylase (fatty acid hydroxylase superfamily)